MAGSPLSAPREIRARWYLQVDKYHRSVNEVCDIFGISRKTYYKWYARDHGRTSKSYIARKAHPHAKLTPRLQAIVISIKRKYNYGPKKMAAYLRDNHDTQITANAIYKFYKKKHLIRKHPKKQEWYTPLKEPFLAQAPGENVQLDVKYVPGANRTWSYQYRFVDSSSNLQYATNMLVKDAEASIKALREARKYFPFQITGIQTDNGSEFRGLFHKYLLASNITHRYIPKRSAPWNGKVERANRSVDDEFYLNRAKPWHTLSEYIKWYNYERPHLGKGVHGITPMKKYLSLAKQKV
jgi:transposase